MTTTDLDHVDVLDPDLYATGDPATNGLPLALFDALRTHRPLHRQELHDPSMIDWTWVVSRHADVDHVATHADVFVSSQGVTLRTVEVTRPESGGKAAMITMDGRAHVTNRRVVGRGFSPAVVRTFEAHYRAMANGILDEALAEGTFDFVDRVATPIPMAAIFDLLGAPVADRGRLLRWSNTFSNATDPELSDGPEAVYAAMTGTWAYALELAEAKRRDPGDDLMSKVVAAVDDDRLDEDELMGMVLLLIGAGNETTRNAMSHGVHALTRHPDQWARLVEGGDAALDAAVEEILRWASPVISLRRTAARDTELCGRPIAAGDPVTVLLASANMDPERIADPLRFDVARTPNPHLAFGKGVHVCLGAALARIELRILFSELVRRVRTIELAGEPRYVRDNFLRGVKALPVTVRLR